MSKYIKSTLVNREKKFSRNYQEKLIWSLISFYKKHNINNKITVSREEIVRRLQEEKEKRDRIKKLIRIYKSYITNINKMDSYNNDKIGSNIIKSKYRRLLHKDIELNIKHNKLLNYFNVLRNKGKNLDIGIKKDKLKMYSKLMKEYKYIFNNISQEHKNDINKRKISSKLLLPNYYFPSKYIEKSLPSQVKHWMSNFYSFLNKEVTSLILLDKFSNELIKRFFSVKRLKRKFIYDKTLERGEKFWPSNHISKKFNYIIRYTRKAAYNGNSNIISYFHPGILKSKWLKGQISKSIKIKKRLLIKKVKIFGTFNPRYNSIIGKWRKLWLAKPIFKHTPFNLVIDLFIYNNKSYKIKKLKNMLLRRIAYKYMYSLYINVYNKINETLNRPPFFYINIIDPKIYSFYSKVINSYEGWIFKYNRGLIISVCLILIKMNESYKNLKNNLLINKMSNISSVYINILNKLSIDQLFTQKKKKINILNSILSKENINFETNKRPYKEKYLYSEEPEIFLSKKEIEKKIQSIKFKTENKEKKKDKRIKKFGEKRISLLKFKKKQIYERRRGKRIDPLLFKERLKSFHLYKKQKEEENIKDNENINEKKYIWYLDKEWEKRNKNKLGFKNNISYDENNNNNKDNIIKGDNSISKFKFNALNQDKNKKTISLIISDQSSKSKLTNKNEIVINNKSINFKSINNNYRKFILNSLFKEKNRVYDKNILLQNQEEQENILFGISSNIYTIKLNKNKIKELKIKKEEVLQKRSRSIIRMKKMIEKINKLPYIPWFKLRNYMYKVDVSNYIKNKQEILISKNYQLTRELNKKKKFFDYSFFIFNKKKSLIIQEKLRKKYILNYINKVEYLEIPKKKKFHKSMKNINNIIPNNTLLSNYNNYKLKKNRNIIDRNSNSKNTKKIWDKLDYSLLSLISKYTLFYQKDKSLYNYISLDFIYNKGKEMLIFSNIWYTLYNLNYIKKEYSNIVKNILGGKTWDTIPNSSDYKPNSYEEGIIFKSINKEWNRTLIKLDTLNERIPNKIKKENKKIWNKYFKFIKEKFFNKYSELKENDKIKFFELYKYFISKVKRKFIWAHKEYWTFKKYHWKIRYYKAFSNYTNNKREELMENKIFFFENIFKVYYRKIVQLYIMEYYKHYLLRIWRNYWIYTFRLFIINKIKIINESHVLLLNFIIVKTLFGLLKYNYRSLIRLKPKYYYLNKIRNYETKFKKINLNSWVNSVKYIKRLRKTPKNFWRRYHRLASMFYGRIVQNAELDAKRKIFVPFVLYFEDILYNIYGKWTIIRLWPLKKYYLSSYILAKRIMTLILWRAKIIKTVSKFRKKTWFFLSLVRYGQITRGYFDYYKNVLSKWPNSLINKINEKKQQNYLTYDNLEYMIKKTERFHKFTTHLTNKGKYSNEHFNLWYKYIIAYKLKKEFKKVTIEDLIANRRPPQFDPTKWLRVWLKPFRKYFHYLLAEHDISHIKFMLSGRTGTRRNNARKTRLIRSYGHVRNPRYWASEKKKFFVIGIPTIRNQMKSSYDYSKTISKSISGALSVKVWITSKISVDIQELLMFLVDIKYLYSQVFNKYYLVARRFLRHKRIYSNRRSIIQRHYWLQRKKWYNILRKSKKYIRNRNFNNNKFNKKFYFYIRSISTRLNIPVNLLTYKEHIKQKNYKYKLWSNKIYKNKLTSYYNFINTPSYKKIIKK